LLGLVNIVYQNMTWKLFDMLQKKVAINQFSTQQKKYSTQKPNPYN